MRDIYDLTDQELEDCIGDNTDLKLIREILEKSSVVTIDGYIDEDRFAEWFAYSIEDTIVADEGTSEYDHAWDKNYNRGFDMADNINAYLEEDE